MAGYPPRLPGESLERFIDRELRPTTKSNQLNNRVVDELNGFIQRNMPYSVNRVEKGGSLGRGTHLRNACDVELVVFLNGYSTVADLFAQLPSLLDNTDNKLRSTHGWKTKLSRGRKINHALHYSLRFEGEVIQVIIRFAVDPYTSGKNQFDMLAEMHRSPPQVRDYYVFCLSKQQNDFVSDLPVRFKDVILLLKDWVLSRSLDVDPFFVELVVVDLWRTMGKPGSADLADALQKAMDKLVHCASIQIIWPDIWPVSYGGGGTPVNTTAPCVWDPATPLHNVAPQGVANSNVCRAAQETLQAWRNNTVAGLRLGESLQCFIEREVRPTPQERDSLKAAVNVLVKDLLHRFNDAVPGKIYPVKEVIKSGSLEKDTAVSTRMDIDLVVFFGGFRDMNSFLEEKTHIIDSLSEFLDKRDNVEIIKTNEWMVKCNLKLDGKKHEVDILPCIDIVALHGGDKQSVYDEMAVQPGNYWEGKKSHYSGCLARVQRDFVIDAVRDTNSKLKDLIRLVKYWSKVHGLKITSYCLELICIAIYREYKGSGGHYNFNMDDLYRRVLQALVNIEDMRISFDDNYRSMNYTALHDKPFLMDPANPFANNMLWEREDRRVVAAMARASLQ